MYGAAVLCCGMFYLAYGEWLSGILFAAVLALPWLSLVLSLPAMVTARMTLDCPALLTQGETGNAWLAGNCPLPMPPFRGRIRLTNRITGVSQDYDPELGLPAAHCGAWQVFVHGARVCDYLGLLSFPLWRKEGKGLLIRPRPVAVENLPDLRQFLARSWRPKFGGGFAENHELRLYRPGDSLNQVHWKLSVKTGKLTIREPMEPQRGLVLLTMNLRGEEAERDRKFGRLLWLGKHLLSLEVSFEIRCLTGEGIRNFFVSQEGDLWKAIDGLLGAPLAKEGDLRDRSFGASWQYHIGGDADVA